LFNGFVSVLVPIKCNECGRYIPKGEEVFKEDTRYECDYSTHFTCQDCYSIRQVFFSSGWYYGEVIERMEEFVYDCNGELSIPCILELTPRARGMVCDMIENTWPEDEEF
jgi:hypothetical protein